MRNILFSALALAAFTACDMPPSANSQVRLYDEAGRLIGEWTADGKQWSGAYQGGFSFINLETGHRMTINGTYTAE